MSVKTIDKSQILELQDHFDRAAGLDAQALADLRALAGQLDGCPVLPVVGAGASHDCGMRLAADIGRDLYADYIGNPAYEPHDQVSEDLSDVAQAIYNKAGQVAAVRSIGLPDAGRWPDVDQIDEHFCTYRALARLVREDLFEEVVGFNYDCSKEAALLSEGFLDSSRTVPGGRWRDHVSVIADQEQFLQLQRPGALTYMKAHGCAQRFRFVAQTDEEKAADAIIVRKSQLTNWRQDAWMRDRLRDRVRTNVLLLIGFSAQDAAVHAVFQDILDEVYREVPFDGVPRVVVVDARPRTPTLRGLVKSGVGGAEPPSGVVTAIDSSTSSTTAVSLVLLTETLRNRLESHFVDDGVPLPAGVDALLATFVVAAPLMLRWTYLLQPQGANEFIQKINVEQAARGGYVPLTVDPASTVRACSSRAMLRREMGLSHDESTREAQQNHGFVVRKGVAYLPVGLSFDELRGACRPGGPVARARAVLRYPSHLECALVTEAAGMLKAVHMETGAEMRIVA